VRSTYEDKTVLQSQLTPASVIAPYYALH